MATRQSIEFDFKQAMAQADKLDTVANNLHNLSARRFETTMQNLSVSWRGENASAYRNKGERLQGKMNDTVNELHNTASEIRKIARRLYDAEMAALNIATQRNY